MAEVTNQLNAFIAVAQAVADETRTRALALLARGELCVCQIVEVLRLAPSTVSQHMTLLHRAGLVERRKEGRWHYYRLASRGSLPRVRMALRWVRSAVADDARIAADRRLLSKVMCRNLAEVCACYR